MSTSMAGACRPGSRFDGGKACRMSCPPPGMGIPPSANPANVETYRIATPWRRQSLPPRRPGSAAQKDPLIFGSPHPPRKDNAVDFLKDYVIQLLMANAPTIAIGVGAVAALGVVLGLLKKLIASRRLGRLSLLPAQGGGGVATPTATPPAAGIPLCGRGGADRAHRRAGGAATPQPGGASPAGRGGATGVGEPGGRKAPASGCQAGTARYLPRSPRLGDQGAGVGTGQEGAVRSVVS